MRRQPNTDRNEDVVAILQLGPRQAETIGGREDDDVLPGTSGADRILGRAGADRTDPSRTGTEYSGTPGWNVAQSWMDVKFNAPYGSTSPNGFGNTPTAPSIGDTIEISLPLTSVNERTRTVKSMEASPLGALYTRVHFVEGALPTGFNPTTCRIINPSTVPVVDLERVHSMGSGGRTVVCQSQDMRIGEVVPIGTRSSNIMATSSSGGKDDDEGDTQLGDGGFKGGLTIGRYIARHSSLDALADEHTDARALLRVEAKTFGQELLAGPMISAQIDERDSRRRRDCRSLPVTIR